MFSSFSTFEPFAKENIRPVIVCYIINLPPPTTKFDKKIKILNNITKEIVKESMQTDVKEALEANDGTVALLGT